MSECAAHRAGLVVTVTERPFGLAWGCRCGLQLGHPGEHNTRPNPIAAQPDSARVCDNGGGNDERPAAPTADRSSHSDSPREPGGLPQW